MHFALRTALLAPTLLASLAAPALAQGGGFTAGDLYLYSGSVDSPAGGTSALVHVDLSAGTADILVKTYTQSQGQGSVVFDPWRQRIVFDGTVAALPAPLRLWAVDAAGQLEELCNPAAAIKALAPTGDGRIYMNAAGTLEPFRYLDATNTLQVLMNDTGTQPFLMDGNFNFDVRGLIYDAGTNALILATNISNVCAGGVANRINLRKLPLSADGTRVVGPITCSQHDVSPSGEDPVGFSYGPAGQIVLVVDSNSNDAEPRILLVDPVTMASGPWAITGAYPGAAATNAGTWCSSLGEVVILDTGINVLRAFGPGETGTGAVLTLTGSVSSAGGSHEVVSMVEVPTSDCGGAWMPYGAGLAGAGGLVPRLTGAGCPEVGGALILRVDRAVGAAPTLLFVGLAPAAVPFKGGTFHVGALALVVALPLGGAPGVAGAGGLDLPAVLPGDPVLAGLDVHLQAACEDAAAVKDVSLSKGLRMEIGG